MSKHTAHLGTSPSPTGRFTFSQQELQLNNAFWFSETPYFPTVLQLCESAGGATDHRCRSIILLQSSELCYTRRSLAGIFVFSFFYFFLHILLYIINQSCFEWPFFLKKKIKSMVKYKEWETRHFFNKSLSLLVLEFLLIMAFDILVLFCVWIFYWMRSFNNLICLQKQTNIRESSGHI